MLESLIISSILAFINPADPSGKTMYPSGLKDCDSTLYSGPPSSGFPQLKLGVPVYAIDKNVIQPGIYEVRISDGKDVLFLIVSGKIQGKLGIISSRTLPAKFAVPVVKTELINSRQVHIIIKYENIEAHCFSDVPSTLF